MHKNQQTKKMDLPSGQYDTPQQLIAGLNQLFSPAPPPYTARNMAQEPPVTLEVTLGQPITYNLGDPLYLFLSRSLPESYHSSA